MLPDIHLDQMTFGEMLEEAKNIIAGCYPEWTDFNYHDPGITLVELFAWLKEIQQYELNHIGEEHQRKYLNLLGTDTQHREGAKTFVCTKGSGQMLLPRGTRLLAPGVVFETEEQQLLTGISISVCFGWFEKKVSYLDGEQLSLSHELEFYPFGRQAETGTCFYLGFSEPLPSKELHRLFVRTSTREGIKRNPVDASVIPLARLSYHYWNGKMFRPLEIIRDETYGFLFDGQLTFCLEEEMEQTEIHGEKAYFLQVRLEESQYDLAPVLCFLDLNTMKAGQRETVAVWLEAEQKDGQEDILLGRHALLREGGARVFFCENGYYREIPISSRSWDSRKGEAQIQIERKEEPFTLSEGSYWILAFSMEEWYQRHGIMGRGRGFPGESFSLDETQVLSSDFELLVEEAERPGIYRRWERRESFSHSGPEDCHYRVDGITGSVVFGDCIHGMAPEGEILLISYTRVLGNRGNVKARKIQHFLEEQLNSIQVSNPWDAAGGKDEETVFEAFARVRAELSRTRNMVTGEDYERAVMKTPGLCIESCRALTEENFQTRDPDLEQTVQIVVKPGSLKARPKPTQAFIQNILQHLEHGRLLGTRIRILAPVYIQLFVCLEVTVHPQYQEAGGQIERAAAEYLSRFQKCFGGSVSYSGLYGHIDRLTCVAAVRSLVLEARGNGVRRNTYGDLLLPGYGIADVIEIECSCSVEE